MPTFDDFYQWFVGLETSNYTIPQTILYALLVLLGLYILYRWIKYQKLPITTPFVLSSMLYVIWGGLLHVVYDVEFVKPDHGSFLRILLTTPQVYILVMIIGLAVLYISYRLQRTGKIKNYIKPFAGFGIAACAVTIGYLVYSGLTLDRFGLDNHFDLVVLFGILGMAAAATVILWALMWYVLRWKYVTHPLYIALMACHFLDAAATSYSLELHPLQYIEQHVLGGALIELTGTAFIMFALKAVILVIAIFVLEKIRKDDNLNILWHLVILVMMIVGLGPGIRDLFRAILWI